MAKIQVKQWIERGEFEGDSADDIEVMEEAGNLLDDACSHEILGQNLFKGKDGKYYTVTIEAVIAKAHPEFVKSVLEDKAKQRKHAAENCERLDDDA